MSEHHRDPSWKRVLYRYRPRIAATLPAPCIEKNCRRAVLPTHVWQVAHIVSVAEALRMGWTAEQINHPSNLGPAHKKCNEVNGGRLGAQLRAQNRAKQSDVSEKRLLPW